MARTTPRAVLGAESITAVRGDTTLLSIEDLTIAFPVGGRRVEVVRSVSFTVDRGELVGLVGESGSGKTMSALAVMRLVPPPGVITAGRIVFDGSDLLRAGDTEMRRVRGARIAMIFQEPMTALNPVFTIGFQIVEALRAHRDVTRAAALREAERLLELVAMPDPRRRLDDYPHRLSGGQRQRAMIAMALACSPEILLADEPTTALDVTVQAQILELLERLRRELRLAVVLITHDLSVVAETCDRVVVMYAGQVVEEAPAATLFAAPSHPYSRGLLAALPRLGEPFERGKLPSIPGQVPDAAERPVGCAFHPRCPEVFDRCRSEAPPLFAVQPDQRSRCFLHAEPLGAQELGAGGRRATATSTGDAATTS